MTMSKLDGVSISDPDSTDTRGTPYPTPRRGSLFFPGFGLAAVNGALLSPTRNRKAAR